MFLECKFDNMEICFYDDDLYESLGQILKEKKNSPLWTKSVLSRAKTTSESDIVLSDPLSDEGVSLNPAAAVWCW